MRSNKPGRPGIEEFAEANVLVTGTRNNARSRGTSAASVSGGEVAGYPGLASLLLGLKATRQLERRRTTPQCVIAMPRGAEAC